MALDGAIKWNKPPKSVYVTRGLIVLGAKDDDDEEENEVRKPTWRDIMRDDDW